MNTRRGHPGDAERERNGKAVRIKKAYTSTSWRSQRQGGPRHPGDVRIHETYISVYEEYQGVRAKTVV